MTTKTKYDRERSERTPRTRGDSRFPMPTKETQDEWSAYMQRADAVAYRLLCTAQEESLNRALEDHSGPWDVAFNQHTDYN